MLALFICLVGLLLYEYWIRRSNPRVALALAMFWTGLLAFLLANSGPIAQLRNIFPDR